MVSDLYKMISEYYCDVNEKKINKLIDMCTYNNYFLKFLILTIKCKINIVCEENKKNDEWVIKNNKQILVACHKKRREIIKNSGKKISEIGFVKNYIENTKNLMDTINDKYINLVKDINLIDKTIDYLSNPKYNLCVKTLEQNSYIEEYSNTPDK